MRPALLALALAACAGRSTAPAPEPLPAMEATSTTGATSAESESAPPADEASEVSLAEPNDPNLRTPERTIRSLIQSIEDEDLYAYTRCFTDEALTSGEAGVSLLEDPEDGGWRTLQAAFYGPWELRSLSIDETEASGSIIAPEADGGGVGQVRFERDEDGWKLADW